MPADAQDPAAATASASRPRGRLRWLQRGALLLAAGTAVGAAAGALWLRELARHTPGLDEVQAVQLARPSIVLAAGGEELARLSNAHQDPITLAQVSPTVVQALLATEDRRFREHHGLDWRRIAGAAWNTLRGDVQGASTLTQQLARNLFPQEIGRERSLERKLKEAIVARRIEHAWSKDRILETYLNTAPFLYNVRGIEMAARSYFGKPAAQLDALESATLVAMLKGTQRYNPVKNPERARDRRNLVLAQMVAVGALPREQFERLRQRPLDIDFRRPITESGEARHFLGYVRARLDEWAERNDADLASDGLVIETTLDLRLQRLAQAAVSEQAAFLQGVAAKEWSDPRVKEQPAPFARLWRERPQLLPAFVRETPRFRALREAGRSDEQALHELLADRDFVAALQRDKTRLSAGFVAIDPRNGEVAAWIGSPDFASDQFDHVAQARRQPGSTFKPFVYGAALLQGQSTEQPYLDEPVTLTAPDGSVWQPTDMGGPSGEVYTLRRGLAQSRNTITAQVMASVGAPAVVAFARAAGVVDAPLDPVPSLALGTSPVSLLEMSGAYATLAALGEQRKPVTIRRIRDHQGREMAGFEARPVQALDRTVVTRLVDMMRGVVASGTGAPLRSRFGVRGDVAGKTGTTQNNTDGWFIALQPTLVTGAWVGFNDQRVTMRSDYWGQGANTALRLVGGFLRQGQREGLVDSKARFPEVAPEPQLPPPERLAPVIEDPGEITYPAGRAPLGGGAMGSGTEVLIGRDAEGRTLIGDRAAMQAAAAARPALETRADQSREPRADPAREPRDAAPAPPAEPLGAAQGSEGPAGVETRPVRAHSVPRGVDLGRAPPRALEPLPPGY